jgi:nitroreductase
MSTQNPVKSPVDALRWRYATKKFAADKKIPDDVWTQLQEALLLSPSSYGLQPWKFVVVTDQEAKDKLSGVCFGQTQPVECSHFIVICRLEKLSPEHIESYIEDVGKKRNAPPESMEGFKNLLLNFRSNMSELQLDEWMAKQCYIALGNLMTSAAYLGVDNCPMEGFDKAKMDEALHLVDKGCRSVVCCALGYRNAEDNYSKMPKVRFDPDRVFINI